jgi:hypothetical protein
MATASGAVLTFGSAGYNGSVLGGLRTPVVAMAIVPAPPAS